MLMYIYNFILHRHVHITSSFHHIAGYKEVRKLIAQSKHSVTDHKIKTMIKIFKKPPVPPHDDLKIKRNMS